MQHHPEIKLLGRPPKLSDDQLALLRMVKSMRDATPTNAQLAKALRCSTGCIDQNLRGLWNKRRIHAGRHV
jgi:hypothetical protein